MSKIAKMIKEQMIPEGWRVVRLGDVAKISTGKKNSVDAIEYGAYPLFDRSMNVKRSNNYIFDGAAIIVPGEGKEFTPHYYHGRFDLHQRAYAIYEIKDADSIFIYYYLWRANRKYFESVAVGSTVPSLRLNHFENFPLHLPPLHEQKAIAEVLSNLDDHIDILGQIIEKKRMIRQGMMQQLLTRKVRLPGFSGEWSLKKIKDIGILYSGLIGKTKSDFGSGSYYITFLNVIENTVINHDKLGQVIVKLNENQNIVQKEDLIFNASSETPNEIGMCAAVINIPKENVYLNSFCFGFRPRDNTKSDSLYLAYYFRSGEGRKLLKFLSQGSTRYNLSKKAFLDISVALPPIAEQTAIATVLSDIDAEIAALEAKKANAMQIKQGAMQQLLTGKIRLTVDTAQKIAPPSHNKHFNEAVIMGVLAAQFGTKDYPLGNFRRTKLMYLFHRHTDNQISQFDKEAAGPFSRTVEYRGAKKIAIQKNYVQEHKKKTTGVIKGSEVNEAFRYFHQWYGDKSLAWLERFRYCTNDQLELLTTVDMTVIELRQKGQAISVAAVKKYIASIPKWREKLARDVFSDQKIANIIKELKTFFV